MSISPFREQARLDKTETLIKDLERKLAANILEQETASKALNAILDKITAIKAKQDAMIEARDAAAARHAHEPGDTDAVAQRELDDAQIKAADLSVLGYLAEISLLNLDAAKEAEAIKPILDELGHAALDISADLEAALQIKIDQLAALISKEQSYPQRLARHLRKCKKFGWADGRLAKAKK